MLYGAPHVCVHFLMPGYEESGRNALRNPCSAVPTRHRKVIVEKNYNNNLKLIDLLNLVDYKAHRIASKKNFNDKGNVVDRITAKRLLSGIYTVIAEYCNGSGPSSIHFYVFSNGYCLFIAENRHTIFDVVEFVLSEKGFKYTFETEIYGEASQYFLSIERLLVMNWVYALLPYAEDRITKNIMNDVTNRPGSNVNEKTNVDDDGDYMGIPYNIEDSKAGNPAEILFSSECIDESLSILTNKQKQVLVSTILEDRTDQKVADILGKERSSVTYVKNRALREIRDSHIWD